MNIFRWFWKLIYPARKTDPAPEIMPTEQENELQRLRQRVKELEKHNKFLLEQSRKIDILAVKAGENAKATAAKFRLIKQNYVNMKLNAAQLLTYVENPKLLAKLPEKNREHIEFMVDVLRQDGAVDPDLCTRSAIAKINRGEFKVRELQPLLAIAPDYQTEADEIHKAMLAGPSE